MRKINNAIEFIIDKLSIDALFVILVLGISGLIFVYPVYKKVVKYKHCINTVEETTMRKICNKLSYEEFDYINKLIEGKNNDRNP
jgi:hypothetical protein